MDRDLDVFFSYCFVDGVVHYDYMWFWKSRKLLHIKPHCNCGNQSSLRSSMLIGQMKLTKLLMVKSQNKNAMALVKQSMGGETAPALCRVPQSKNSQDSAQPTALL